MSSWFSSFESAADALNKIGDKLGDELPSFETASEAFNKINDGLGDLSNKVQNKVQSALPVDSDIINKLTLRSDELVKEHELLDAQEKRKELVREYLSELLPWETKDESKEILVEQCKEAILNLSKDKATFETPFILVKGQMFNADNTDNYTEIDFENEGEDDADDNAEDAEKEEKEDKKDVGDSTTITPEEKLEKMQPLPLLLEHFDIDTHVGLIERVFKADENLVDIHSKLSGAGEKEILFWKNYFFHCAYTRYQQGLSIEEIWSSKPKAIITGNNEMTTPAPQANQPTLNEVIEKEDDEAIELDFEEEIENEIVDDMEKSESQSSIPETTEAKSEVVDDQIIETSSNHGKASTRSESASDFEIVNEAIGNIDDNADLDDLDDLEAEIARELGED